MTLVSSIAGSSTVASELVEPINAYSMYTRIGITVVDIAANILLPCLSSVLPLHSSKVPGLALTSSWLVATLRVDGTRRFNAFASVVWILSVCDDFTTITDAAGTAILHVPTVGVCGAFNR